MFGFIVMSRAEYTRLIERAADAEAVSRVYTDLGGAYAAELAAIRPTLEDCRRERAQLLRERTPAQTGAQAESVQRPAARAIDGAVHAAATHAAQQALGQQRALPPGVVAAIDRFALDKTEAARALNLAVAMLGQGRSEGEIILAIQRGEPMAVNPHTTAIEAADPTRDRFPLVGE